MDLEQASSRITELEVDNERLRRLLDQRDAPGELRHRLRGTLALLRILIRRSAEGRSNLASYVAHLEDRLESMMRVHADIDLHGELDLAKLIGDEFMTYAEHEGPKLRISGPPVRLQPRAGQAMSLAIHELVMNAVEHGALSVQERTTEVTWNVESSDAASSLTFNWKETGLSGLTEPETRGFGTEVLTKMLQHELGAVTVLTFEPDGLRCTIWFPMPPRVGHLADEPSDGG